MDITIRQLEIFRAVVISGSITRAAQSYGLSQPTMSQHLSRLEEVLGAQLLVRSRSGQVALTPDGEFWFRSSEEIIGRMAEVMNAHENRKSQARAVLRLGTTPALRGRFTAAAARIALSEPDFSKFELRYEATSGGLARQLRLHRINMAILAESSIAGEAASFAVARLFDDAIAWAVPAEVSEEEIRAALRPGADAASVNPLLRRHVEVQGALSTRAASDSWYRNTLPFSVPALTAPTFATAIEFVAEGLATGHVLLSVWPNLPDSSRDRVRLFALPGLNRSVVLAMHRHLLSHGGFARVFNALTEFCGTRYRSEMDTAALRSLDDLAAPAAPAA